MENKELEILKAEIERFKAEAMKMHFVQTWAETYKTDPFEHMVDDVRGVFWLKAQAYQLWQFWNSAKATPEGFVLVPREPTQDMMIAALAVISTGIGKDHIDVEIIQCWKKMIEAQEQSHD
jgi:hypothetical protein